MQIIWTWRLWRLWRLSIGEARYYGWLHIGPLHVFAGMVTP